jgi:hypothetical protein
VTGGKIIPEEENYIKKMGQPKARRSSYFIMGR